jgi:hypothetical protein
MADLSMIGSQDDPDPWELVDSRVDAPATPSTTSDGPSEPSQYEPISGHGVDEEDDFAQDRDELVPRVKPGGYDSRIEQVLYENPNLPIMIVAAGKSSETGGNFIVYTIRTGVRQSPFPHPTFHGLD